MTIGSSDGSLNNSLTIKTALTGLILSENGAVTSTGLNPGGVIRINGISIPAKRTLIDGSGFTKAFGIPAPIWGYNNPWVIIAPSTAPHYAFKASAIAAGLATLHSPLGWADGIAPNNGSITSAIVMDTKSLTALVAGTTIAGHSGFSAAGTSGTPSIASASGIVNAGGPTGQGGQWNIGVNACGSSSFSVLGSSLHALIAATNGGQLVVANGATIS